ncbi:hypothetical protein ACXX82_01160, partial [Glaciimonas sp. GNP009]
MFDDLMGHSTGARQTLNGCTEVPVISKVPLSVTPLAMAILPGPDNANVAPPSMDADPGKTVDTGKRLGTTGYCRTHPYPPPPLKLLGGAGQSQRLTSTQGHS